MSLVLQIVAGSFDGTSEISLADGRLDVERQRFEYSFAQVGRVPLYTHPEIGSNDMFIQQIDAQGNGPITLSLEFPSGGRVPLENWNAIVPQGSMLIAEAAPGVSGTLNLWLKGISSRTWYLVQDGHQYAPKPVGKPPESLPVIADGQTTFPLTAAPADPDSTWIDFGSIIHRHGGDYTIVGALLEWLANPPTLLGDTLVLHFQ